MQPRKSARRALLIVNPLAGTLLPSRPDKLTRLLEAEGLRVEARVVSDCAGMAARAEDERFDLVIAAGGDGTLRSVALATKLPVAVMPVGTSNSVARSLGIPLDIRRAASVAARGRPRPVDVGEIAGPNIQDGRLAFLLCASAGYDAEVVRRYEARRDGRANLLSYAFLAIQTAFAYRNAVISISEEGRRVGAGRIAIASNMRHYAGILKPAPGADPFDGMLDLTAIRGDGPATLLAVAAGALFSRAPSPSRAVARRAKSMRWESSEPVPVQIDGEPAGYLPVDLRVREGALMLVLPTPEEGER